MTLSTIPLSHGCCGVCEVGDMCYGAVIERGSIKEPKDDGYIVKSLDRDGIETTALKAFPAGEAEYSAGDMVYFFVFPDGTGMILCKT